MDISRYRDELEAVIPGVYDAYMSLKTDNGMGFYTSNGAFFNHTLFGRDNAMAAKFVADIDHEAAKETIIALAALQGTQENPRTHESHGRIHHEYRDFRTWQGSWTARAIFKLLGPVWGVKDKELLTYYATDTTALYIRLVHKYVQHIDRSFLDKTITNRQGEKLTIAESIARAAEWLSRQLDDQAHIVIPHTNGWSLPYQTFQDSSTAFARTDGHLANFRRGITYTEVQAFTCDALEDATHLLEDHERRHDWQTAAHRMRDALVNDFWIDEKGYFGSAYDRDGLVDMASIGAGWTLNTSLWDEVDEDRRKELISSIVRKLFSDSFLTPVGLRSRAIDETQPLPGVLEYHGSRTVWPMFTFMVIEGLRRHELYRLAEQLENRLVNAINAAQDFPEFMLVSANGELLKETSTNPQLAIDAQMRPETNIAFTIIPSMMLALRVANRRSAAAKRSNWQAVLEDEILAAIEHVQLVSPNEALATMPIITGIKLRRWRGNIRSGLYFMKERSRM